MNFCANIPILLIYKYKCLFKRIVKQQKKLDRFDIILTKGETILLQHEIFKQYIKSNTNEKNIISNQ